MGEECVVPPPLHVLPQTTAPQPGPLQGRCEWGPLCPTAVGMQGQGWEDGATKSCSQMDRNNPEAHPQPRTPRGGCMPRPAQDREAAPSQDVQEGGAEWGDGSSSGRRHAEAKRQRSAGQLAEVGPASGRSWGSVPGGTQQIKGRTPGRRWEEGCWEQDCVWERHRCRCSAYTILSLEAGATGEGRGTGGGRPGVCL